MWRDQGKWGKMTWGMSSIGRGDLYLFRTIATKKNKWR